MIQRLTLILVAMSLSVAALAQAPATPQASPARAERFIAMPAMASPIKHTVIGKITFAPLVSLKDKPVAVVFYVDAKEVGRITDAPYRYEWDTNVVADGEHAVKWAGISAEGKEISTGTAVIVVSNKTIPAPSTPGGPQSNPTGTKPGSSDKKPADSDANPPVAPFTPSIRPIQPPHPEPKPSGDFTKYSSDSYDISIDHPATWSVKDQTSGLPKGWKSGYWLVVSTDPVAQSSCVVNVRHRMLDREHTADTFAKFTPYVASWTRSEINGRPVFSTTAGSAENKRVVHRIMMLDGRHLWMMNCIDTSGKSAEESRKIFLHIAQSLAPATVPEPAPAEAPVTEKTEE